MVIFLHFGGLLPAITISWGGGIIHYSSLKLSHRWKICYLIADCVIVCRHSVWKCNESIYFFSIQDFSYLTNSHDQLKKTIQRYAQAKSDMQYFEQVVLKANKR